MGGNSDRRRRVITQKTLPSHLEVKSYVEKEKTPVDQAASSAAEVSKKIAEEMMAHRQPVIATPSAK